MSTGFTLCDFVTFVNSLAGTIFNSTQDKTAFIHISFNDEKLTIKKFQQTRLVIFLVTIKLKFDNIVL